MSAPPPRDHGGGVDAACARWGGRAADWLDLSTGINPVPWPGPGRALPMPSPRAWAMLPDAGATRRLADAARVAFAVPEGAMLLAVPGASAAIAAIPRLAPPGRAAIPAPTYNEHAAAFAAAGWAVEGAADPRAADALVVVHPNNPDGRLWREADLPPAPLTVIDESFADAAPGASLMRLAARPGTLVLRSFGKFWGLAGLRLGFVAGDPALVGGLAEMLGPWPVSGPALEIGAAALEDGPWAEAARARLGQDATRLDALLAPHARPLGGTPLFRLFEAPDAAALHTRLARARILTRTFPWSAGAIRLGLPPPGAWARLEAALG